MSHARKLRMAILTYVTEGSARGPVDVDVTLEYAARLWRDNLTDVAAPFLSVDGSEAQRLPVAPSHDAIASLEILRDQVDESRRWADLVLAQEVTHANLAASITEAPVRTQALWNRYPAPLYRGLLGARVAEAMLEVERRRAAITWTDTLRRIITIRDRDGVLPRGGIVMPVEALDPKSKRTWTPLARYCPPDMIELARTINAAAAAVRSRR